MKKGSSRKQIDLMDKDLKQLKKIALEEKRSLKNLIEKVISDFVLRKKAKGNEEA
jgi:hypothetical protein